MKHSLERPLVEPRDQAGSIAERKKVRSEKIEHFRDDADHTLGESFDEKGWVPGTVDNTKKAITKVYGAHVSRDLKLPYVPGDME